MKKFMALIGSVFLIGALCAACTPGSIIDTLNGLGVATPGNAIVSPGNGASVATPGNAVFAATPGNAQ